MSAAWVPLALAYLSLGVLLLIGLLAERKRDAADLEEERQLVEQYRNLLL